VCNGLPRTELASALVVANSHSGPDGNMIWCGKLACLLVVWMQLTVFRAYLSSVLFPLIYSVESRVGVLE